MTPKTLQTIRELITDTLDMDEFSDHGELPHPSIGPDETGPNPDCPDCQHIADLKAALIDLNSEPS